MPQGFVRWVLAPGAIIITVLACYWSSLDAGFVWDDTASLLLNPGAAGMSAENLHWAFSLESGRTNGHYQPLTWMSYWLDFWLGGNQAIASVYHLGNLLYFLLHCMLIYGVFCAVLMHYSRGSHKVVWYAFFATAFYALHPLRVESVAWVTERRDLLSGIFLTAAAWSYWRHRAIPTQVDARWYWLSLLFVLISLLCKAWGITFFVLLLLMDYLLDRNLLSKWQRTLFGKLPFILLGMLFGMFAVYAQDSAGAMLNSEQLDVSSRLMQASYGLLFYLYKTFLPFDLSPYYGREVVNFYSPIFWVCVVVNISLWGLLWRYRHQQNMRILAVAYASYAVLVSPALGLAQSGPQIVADRYSYTAILPLILGVTFVVSEFLTKGVVIKHAFIPSIAMSAYVSLLAFITFNQAHIWQNNLTLWTRAIEHEPTNPTPHLVRARWRTILGDLSGAIEDYEAVKKIAPRMANPYVNTASIKMSQSDYQGALNDINKALELAPGDPATLLNLAVCYINFGRHKEAYYPLGLVISEGDKEKKIAAYFQRAMLRLMDLEGADNRAQALEDLSAVLTLDPRHLDARWYRIKILEEQQRNDLLSEELATLLEYAPKNWPFITQAQGMLSRYPRH